LNQTNIPGLHLLRNADLMLIFTRFRELPDSQMKHIHEYLEAGKPVIGLRTSTHAFAYSRNKKSIYAKYSFDSKVKGWENGFGKIILGETWIDHHGDHGKEGTRGLIDGIQQKGGNPILNGVKDIWVPTDVYGIRNLGRTSTVLVYGQATNGMNAQASPNLDKSVMPVAWTKTYTAPNGKKGKVFATTMGASVDLVNEDLRRLIVNAVFWATGLEKKIPEKADVNIIGDYQPTFFGFDSFKSGSKPEKYR
jgi:type 1 glutamine amidotransferase